MQEKSSPEDNFSSRLRLAANLSGLKDREIAARCGISPVYFSALVNGKRTTNNKELITKLAQITNVNFDWLYKGDEGYRLKERMDAWGMESEEVKLKAKYDKLLAKVNELFCKLSDSAINEISEIVTTLDWEELYTIVSAQRGRRK